MFKDLVNGLRVFINKKTPLVLALLLSTFFGFNYVSNTLSEDLILGVSLKEYPSFLINYYGFELLWFLVLVFGFFFLTNYATYLISHIINKSNKKILADIPNCITYTFFVSLIFLALGIIGYLSMLYLGAFAIVLLVIIGILALVISLETTFGLIFLAVSKNIKESLSRAWVFLKQKFWILLLLIIILGIINFMISYFFELILYKYQDSETIALILYASINVIISAYMTGVFSSFIKKRK